MGLFSTFLFWEYESARPNRISSGSCLLHHPQTLGREPLRLAAGAHGPPCAGGLAGAGRLVCWHELVGAGADQVGAAHRLQRLAQHGPVVGVVIAQERLVQAALAQALDGLDLAAAAMT